MNCEVFGNLVVVFDCSVGCIDDMWGVDVVCILICVVVFCWSFVDFVKWCELDKFLIVLVFEMIFKYCWKIYFCYVRYEIFKIFVGIIFMLVYRVFM